MKILVCGSRSLTGKVNCEKVWRRLDCAHRGLLGRPLTIITGGAQGPDSFAERWARKTPGVKLVVVKPDWSRHGPKAGIVRNCLMVGMLTDPEDLVLAFWDRVSRGTRHTIDYARVVGCHAEVCVEPPSATPASGR